MSEFSFWGSQNVRILTTAYIAGTRDDSYTKPLHTFRSHTYSLAADTTIPVN
jgi:hypothetical protein